MKLTKQEFMRLADNCWSTDGGDGQAPAGEDSMDVAWAWTHQRDEELVWALSTLCDNKELSPWNVTPALLVSDVVPKVKVGPPLGVTRQVASQYPQPGSIEHALGLVCRLAVLRVFNKRLLKVLPLLDLSDASRSGSCVMWHRDAAALALGLPPSAVARLKAMGALHAAGTAGLPLYSPARPSVSEAGMCHDLCAARGAVFLQTKKQVLATVLERTLTRPKKAEDEYDYPEDLSQLELNRPKAAAARELADPHARVQGSMIGQAFDKLHFQEPTRLRLGYTHPMDDGQQRAFKVKLEGEGVDDYGGPYREVFAQFAQELQATTDNASGFGFGVTDTSVAGLRGAAGGGAATDAAGEASAASTATATATDRAPAASAENATSSSGDDDSTLECVLPLLLPCPNRRNGTGKHKERFVLHPGAPRLLRASGDLELSAVEMYHFVGQLLGIALRSRVHMHLSLASVVWKALVSAPLDVSDLESVDTATVSFLRQLIAQWYRARPRPDANGNLVPAPESARAELAACLETLTWTVVLSDGTEEELCPGGTTRTVDEGDVPAYCLAVLQARLFESWEAAAAMRDGLSSIVPSAALSLFSWREMELLMCGRGDVNIDLLQRNTEYDEDVSPDDPHVQSFWRVLRSFTSEQRQQFLRFVWARSRLPPTAAEFTQKFKMQAALTEAGATTSDPNSDGNDVVNNPDMFLPKAHTCFFSINLPKYSSDEIMREKLLYAIFNCLEMDADFRLTENEMGDWGDGSDAAGATSGGQ